MPAKRELDGTFTGLRSEMDRLWNQFVVQCEDMEEKAANGKPTLSTTLEERVHSKGFFSGQAITAKRIRNSVDHPKYDKATYPYFDKEPLSRQFKAKADECRKQAEPYYRHSDGPHGQSVSYKSFMLEAKIWDEAAKMALEGGD